MTNAQEHAAVLAEIMKIEKMLRDLDLNELCFVRGCVESVKLYGIREVVLDK